MKPTVKKNTNDVDKNHQTMVLKAGMQPFTTSKINRSNINQYKMVNTKHCSLDYQSKIQAQNRRGKRGGVGLGGRARNDVSCRREKNIKEGKKKKTFIGSADKFDMVKL